ncbi:MAG: NAD(P)/FAD-dependent oxidoreductase [Methanobacteriaceae archaeon]|nr:NAD(P)/FAD-dependent oxidoreductase [Methanobacteriaceae archaeon]MDO9627081.1 NAD(P)/FAD-dependent oxidoreductase [Methanobacteriaceae archaeon]
MYDVIVIGVGPAGCMAAKKTAEAGLNVLLVEKKSLPREKSCSGILIQKSIKVVEKEFGKIPERIFSQPVLNQGIIITNEEGQVYPYQSEGYNIWRNTFDEWLALNAEKAGAELRTSTKVMGCEEKEDHVLVQLEDYTEKARWVIACDGAGSRIKRNILEVDGDYIITYQTFCRGLIDLGSAFFHAFLDTSLSQYDAWFNVKDDYLVIGVGVKDSSKMKEYHANFVSYLESNFNLKIESVEKEETGLMPHIRSGFNVDLGKGRLLFAGEAANLLNPIGEGISIALASGYCAGEAVIGGSDVLKGYNDALQGEIDYMVRQWRFLGNISELGFDYR